MTYNLVLMLAIGFLIGSGLVVFFMADKVYDKLIGFQNQLNVFIYRTNSRLKGLEGDHEHFINRLQKFSDEQSKQRDFAEDILLEHSVALIDLEKENAKR